MRLTPRHAVITASTTWPSPPHFSRRICVTGMTNSWRSLLLHLTCTETVISTKSFRGACEIHSEPTRREGLWANDQHGPWDSQPRHWEKVGLALAQPPQTRRAEDAGRALSPDEEKRLLAAIPMLRAALVGTFVRVALMTGMRFGEIVSLTWGASRSIGASNHRRPGENVFRHRAAGSDESTLSVVKIAAG